MNENDDFIIKLIPKWAKNFLYISISCITLLTLILIIFVYSTANKYIENAPNINNDTFDLSTQSKIYDKDGKLITEIGIEKREEIDIKNVPKKFKNAILMTEDKRFYQHRGVDLEGVLSSSTTILTGNFGDRGGSSITQQLIKLSALDQNEKTLSRKAKEAYLSFALERSYSKDEILEMYLNKVYMGNGIYGIGTASKYYYGKPLDELNLNQISILAGIPNSPEYFNPYKKDSKPLEKRRNTVLYSMYKNKKISEKTLNENMNKDVKEGMIPAEKQKGLLSVPTEEIEFINYVIDEMKQKYGKSLYTEGLNIYTNLDRKKQKLVYDYVHGNEYSYNKKDERLLKSIALLDTKTGKVLGVSGGNKDNEPKLEGFNYATDLNRQAGSVMKPILAYAPALEYMGYGTESKLEDKPTKYKSGQQIYNYDRKYKGDISLKEALATSRNIPAYNLFTEFKMRNAFAFSDKLGFDYAKDNNIVESAILGSVSNASPIKLASAYATFGNKGVYNEGKFIDHVSNKEGITIYEPDYRSDKVMSEQGSYLMFDVLRETIKLEGSGYEVRDTGVDLGGKTGTSNYTEEEHEQYNIPKRASPDHWFVGVSPKYSLAIWTGNDKRNEYVSLEQQRIPQLMAKQLFEKDLNHKDKIKKPTGIKNGKIEAKEH